MLKVLRKTTFAMAMAMALAACASTTSSPTTAGSPPADVTSTAAPDAPTTTTAAATTTTLLEPNGIVITIDIDGFAFKPAEVTVTRGTTIVWRNLDGVGHTATAVDGSFRTGTLGPDETQEAVLGEPGTYDYFCSIHNDMRATIIVEG